MREISLQLLAGFVCGFHVVAEIKGISSHFEKCLKPGGCLKSVSHLLETHDKSERA